MMNVKIESSVRAHQISSLLYFDLKLSEAKYNTAQSILFQMN